MRFKVASVVASVVGLSFAVCASPTRASLIAYDSAGDSTYNAVGTSGYIVGLNGGYGWGGPWQATGELYSRAAAYVGSSTQFGGGDINSPQVPDGRAWELNGRAFSQGKNAAIVRPFNGALSPGQTFSMDYANGPLYDVVGRPFPGVLLGDVGVMVGNGTTDWPEDSNIDYEVLSTTSSVDTGIRVTDQGIHIELTILDAARAQFTITSLAPGGQSATVVIPSSSVSSVEVINTAGSPIRDQPGDMFFNNIAITPEPSFSLMIGFGIVATLALKGRSAC